MLENNQNKSLVLIKDLGYVYHGKNIKNRTRYGLYRCFCGIEFRAQMSKIKTNNIKSCGCYRRKRMIEINTIHGLRNHKLYIVWKNIIERCTNSQNKSYKNYGGRGISICEKWLDLENFINDMYPSYEDGLSIDRIDVNGNYEPSNCRWATKELQSRNTRKLYSHNTSGYRGVSFLIKSNKWLVQIMVDKKKIYLGCFSDKIEAAKAYDKYVINNNLEHTRNFS